MVQKKSEKLGLSLLCCRKSAPEKHLELEVSGAINQKYEYSIWFNRKYWTILILLPWERWLSFVVVDLDSIQEFVSSTNVWRVFKITPDKIYCRSNQEPGGDVFCQIELKTGSVIPTFNFDLLGSVGPAIGDFFFTFKNNAIRKHRFSNMALEASICLESVHESDSEVEMILMDGYLLAVVISPHLPEASFQVCLFDLALQRLLSKLQFAKTHAIVGWKLCMPPVALFRWSNRTYYLVAQTMADAGQNSSLKMVLVTQHRSELISLCIQLPSFTSHKIHEIKWAFHKTKKTFVCGGPGAKKSHLEGFLDDLCSVQSLVKIKENIIPNSPISKLSF